MTKADGTVVIEDVAAGGVKTTKETDASGATTQVAANPDGS
jgi:hypothetical protein